MKNRSSVVPLSEKRKTARELVLMENMRSSQMPRIE